MEPIIEQAKKDIANAASEAVKVIAGAASEAAHVVANAASEAVNVSKKQTSSDHDLLIELKTRMEWLKTDIQWIKDGTADKIQELQRYKLDVKDSYPIIYQKGVEERLKDHDDRIKSQEITKQSTNILLSIWIWLMVILAAMLIYHLFGIKV